MHGGSSPFNGLVFAQFATSSKFRIKNEIGRLGAHFSDKAKTFPSNFYLIGILSKTAFFRIFWKKYPGQVSVIFARAAVKQNLTI